MMLYRSLLVLVSASLSLTAGLAPSTVDQIVESTRNAFQVPGVAVAIVHGDQVVYSKGFGVRKAGSTDPVTTSTRFAIGSTTKAFTTAAMGILVDDGRMQWDDAVRKHIPWFHLSDPLADANVTMRDIVTHRTGLSRHDQLWYNSPFGREEIIRRIGFVDLTKPFRSAYQYQNIMFLTAGYAVGRIAGSSWEEFVRERIWSPLGFTNSDFSAADAVKAADVASPHVVRDGVVRMIPWRNLDNIGPAGSINSCLNDLTRWVTMQLNGGVYQGKRIVKEATLREMHSPQTVIRVDDPNSRSLNIGTHMMAYGLAWVVQDYKGHPMVSHGGAIDGFRAQVALLPEERYGIIVLMNLGDNNVAECLRSQLADHLLDDSTDKNPVDWVKLYKAQAAKNALADRKQREETEQSRHKDTRPSLPLASYAGTYEHPAYGVASVTAGNGSLQIAWSNWRSELEHFHFDVFRATQPQLAGSLTQFRLDSMGRVTGVRLLDQEFTRKP